MHTKTKSKCKQLIYETTIIQFKQIQTTKVQEICIKTLRLTTRNTNRNKQKSDTKLYLHVYIYQSKKPQVQKKADLEEAMSVGMVNFRKSNNKSKNNITDVGKKRTRQQKRIQTNGNPM